MNEQEKVVPGAPGATGPGKSASPPPPPPQAAQPPPKAAAAPKVKTKKKGKPAPTPRKTPPGKLPPWKVLLHNDDKNTVEDVIKAIVQLVHLSEQDAESRTKEADRTGLALLVITHKERAELYQEQFASKSLTVSIEPAN